VGEDGRGQFELAAVELGAGAGLVPVGDRRDHRFDRRRSLARVRVDQKELLFDADREGSHTHRFAVPWGRERPEDRWVHPIGPFVDWIAAPPAAGGAGPRLAVKDLVDVAGLPTGAGHPRWLATHPVADRSADVVNQLTAAGAV